MRHRISVFIGCLLILILAVFLLLGLIGSYMVIYGQTVNSVHRTLSMGSYTVTYDSVLLIPVTADWLCDTTFMGESRREPSWRFFEDVRVPSPRATHDDYTRSGYDRGHLVPAADRSKSTQLMRSTFIMTNVCPQSPALNRGAWKRLEDGCRAIARNGQALAIHVDVVFWHADTLLIGRHHVAVPHAFVKTIRDFSTDTICYSKYFQND